MTQSDFKQLKVPLCVKAWTDEQIPVEYSNGEILHPIDRFDVNGTTRSMKHNIRTNIANINIDHGTVVTYL